MTKELAIMRMDLFLRRMSFFQHPAKSCWIRWRNAVGLLGLVFGFFSSTAVAQPKKSSGNKSTPNAIQAQVPLNVMSFNIRLNTASDSLNAWPYRKDKAAAQIKFHEVHILGVQEALYDQMLDLQERLPQFKYVGVGRDDGKTKGEFSAIFYDTTRLKVLESSTFWLSETPEVPGSKSWDAAITRVASWAKFQDIKTKKIFFHFNTHFDHRGAEARLKSAELILVQIKKIAGSAPVVFTGDFNARPQDAPIKTILGTSGADQFFHGSMISEKPHYGPTGTFNAFQSKETGPDPIDFIFVKKGIRVLQYAVFSQTWGGRFSSDHFPVFATVVIP
jgi:endonuclease/exonuclease/phosphatase family metal-dependent hydrolase